jgi:hypothetical protein
MSESVGAIGSHLAFGVYEESDDLRVRLLHETFELLRQVLYLRGRQTVGKVNFENGDELFGSQMCGLSDREPPAATHLPLRLVCRI